jgi:CMP-N-acetylneuraminic acid synthetase
LAKIVAIIPARCGSIGLPNKNIKEIDGVPLLVHSINTAQNVCGIDRIVVSTDSWEYAEIATENGAEAILRPGEISTAHSSNYSYIKHVLDHLGEVPEYVVVLMPTSPMRDPKVIEEAIESIKQDPDADSLAAISEDQGFRTTVICDGYLKYYKTDSFSLDSIPNARQLNPKTYSLNGYVYICRVESVLRNKDMMGRKSIAFKTPYTVDINTREDFEYAVQRIKSGKHRTHQSV